MFQSREQYDLACLAEATEKKGVHVPENITKHHNSSWIELGRELKKRTLEPFSHASFVIYFVVAVIAIGGVGFWIELYSYLLHVTQTPEQTDPLASLRTAVITFFPALAGSACLQLVWAENHQKSLRAFGVLFLCLMTVIALAISPSVVGNRWALILGSISSIASLWTWWIANAKQQDLLDIDPEAPLGGDKDAKLAGDLSGFTV